jgi:hypothetical protein
MYRESRFVCDELQPGSYRAICGETITPGNTGFIVITHCSGTTALNAINQTGCTFYLGNLVTANVDPCCVVHFTGCGPSEETVCCDKSIAICVNGNLQIIKLNTQSTWLIQSCCGDCFSGFIAIRPECVGTTITAYYASYCYGPGGSGPTVTTGTMDWSDLCATPSVSYDDTVTVNGSSTECEINILASFDLEDAICDPCGDTPTETCCDKDVWLCLNNESVQRSVDGGTYTWTVTDCCGDCSGVATLQATLRCANGIVEVVTSYVCDGGTPLIQNTSLGSGICNSTAPVVVNIPTPTCFLRLQISQGAYALGCDECPVPGVQTDCCENEIPETLDLVISSGPFAGSYTMTWDGSTEWVIDGSPGFTARLACSSSFWGLTIELDLYGTDTEACDPFELTFDGGVYTIS